jgi:flagellar basal-body rod protein FlgB
MINPFFDGNQTHAVLQAALQGYGARYQAVVHNIANVDTPGFQRLEVAFEDNLRKEIKRLRPSAATLGASYDEMEKGPLSRFRPEVRTDKSAPIRADGSNVSIEREMGLLYKNSGKINDLTELLIRNYSQIKAAIRGRN